MKLLIVTQIMDKNDPILGFFHRWVEEFAKHCTTVHVICLKEGVCTLPEHVHVHSLGKETQEASSLTYAFRLMKLSWNLRREYGTVFVHMNPEYVIAGAPVWKLLHTPVTFWYAHGAVSFRLRLATWFSNLVFTSTKSGFRFESPKRRVVGQGIDTVLFSPQSSLQSHEQIKLITAGRISSVKNIETLINAVAELKAKGTSSHLKIVGQATTEAENAYGQRLRQFVIEKSLSEEIEFMGPVTQSELVVMLHQADIFISDGATGSLDKALLEAMASGLMVVSSNESFGQITPEPRVTTFPSQSSSALAELVVGYWELPEIEKDRYKQALRKCIETRHSLNGFINKIITEIVRH